MLWSGQLEASRPDLHDPVKDKRALVNSIFRIDPANPEDAFKITPNIVLDGPDVDLSNLGINLRFSPTPAGKRAAVIILAAIFLAHVLLFISLFPTKIVGLFTPANLALLAYLGIGAKSASSLFSARVRQKISRALQPSSTFKTKVTTILYYTYLAMGWLGAWPVYWFASLVMAFSASNRYNQFTRHDIGETYELNEELSPFTFLFCKYISDVDVSRFRTAYVCGCILFIFCAAEIKALIRPSRTFTFLLLTCVFSVSAYLLMNVLIGQDLRMVCKRKRGPVAVNLLQTSAFLICNGVIAASLLDVTVFGNPGSVLRATLQILASNCQLLADPVAIVKALAIPSFEIWKGLLFLAIYWFLASELLDVRVWRDWQRNPQDWLFLSTHYFAAANFPKVVECLQLAMDADPGEGLGAHYFLIAGFASLEAGEASRGLSYLNNVPIPADAGVNGPPGSYWSAWYSAHNGDFKKAAHELAELSEFNFKSPQFAELLATLHNLAGPKPALSMG
jgi:hypothetical protein